MRSGTDVNKAAETIIKGGIVAYPTEAVYGLGCDPLNKTAVNKLSSLKNRKTTKGFILLASNWRQIESYIPPLTEKEKSPAMESWPGPTTWLFPAAKNTPSWLTGDSNKIAIRITAHPLAKELCEKTNKAIISTSANLSNQPAMRDYTTVINTFENKLDYILEGLVGDLDNPTCIIDLLTRKIVRK